jgi:flagellar motor switch protein FliN/FliY
MNETPETEIEEQEIKASESVTEDSGDAVDDISWDDVQGELDQQKEMIRQESSEKAIPEVAVPPGTEAGAKVDVPANIEFILDIPLQVTAELGRSKMVINDLLQLGQGSVIELAKLAGEPLDVFVNGKLVARGEAVVVNEKFGIRLTDIISPAERIKQLS